MKIRLARVDEYGDLERIGMPDWVWNLRARYYRLKRRIRPQKPLATVSAGDYSYIEYFVNDEQRAIQGALTHQLKEMLGGCVDGQSFSFKATDPFWVRDLVSYARSEAEDALGVSDYEKYSQTHDFVGEEVEEVV